MLSPRKYRDMLDVSADNNHAVVAPSQGSVVSDEMRNLLEYTENWTHWPDSERVRSLVAGRVHVRVVGGGPVACVHLSQTLLGR